MLNVPILIIAYKRPETTQKVFDAVRKQQPRQLFVVANAPNPEHTDDIEKCRITRSIFDQIDWDCDLKTIFREKHLGINATIVDGINWFFDNVPEGIILEDDCVPDQSFFRFCSELLEKYRNTLILPLFPVIIQNSI